jgi:hypothetical protein
VSCRILSGTKPLPLSAAVRRSEVHTRTLQLHVYRREDDLFDIEGHVVDVKPISVEFHNSHRSAGEPVHDLRLRLTINRELEVVDAQARMDVGAYPYCNGAEPGFAALKGLRIGPGWNRSVRERVGGGKGCTHLVEMLSQMATTALQAVWSEGEGDQENAADPADRELRNGMIGSCYTYRPNSQFVKLHFPRHFQD